MREPAHAANIIRAMVDAVRIPVTVKMRAGWNEQEISAPELARRVEDAGAAAIAVHGRTAAQSYSGESDWSLIARVAQGVTIPVFGSGDCVEPSDITRRLGYEGIGGVLVGRGALRNPWIFAQAAQAAAGHRVHPPALDARGHFLLDYIDLLLSERVDEADGFRHAAPGQTEAPSAPARGRERWVINKLRALGSWYTKGIDNGSHLRVAINAALSIPELRQLIQDFFFGGEPSSRPDRTAVPVSSAIGASPC
jgi:tRNA-dihydrouridine synthase